MEELSFDIIQKFIGNEFNLDVHSFKSYDDSVMIIINKNRKKIEIEFSKDYVYVNDTLDKALTKKWLAHISGIDKRKSSYEPTIL